MSSFKKAAQIFVLTGSLVLTPQASASWIDDFLSPLFKKVHQWSTNRLLKNDQLNIEDGAFSYSVKEAEESTDPAAKEAADVVRRIKADSYQEKTAGFIKDVGAHLNELGTLISYGRDAITERLMRDLSRDDVQSIVLNGAGGEGKTHIIVGLLQELKRLKAENGGIMPALFKKLEDLKVFSFDVDSQKFRDKEQRREHLTELLKDVTAETEEAAQKAGQTNADMPTIVIHITQSHPFVAPKEHGGRVDINEVLSEIEEVFYAQANVKVIIEGVDSQVEEMRKIGGHIGKSSVIDVPTLPEHEILTILKEYARAFEKLAEGNIKFTDEMIETIYNKAAVYYSSDGMPAGAIHLLQQTAMRKAFFVKATKESPFSELMRAKIPLKEAEKAKLERLLENADDREPLQFARRRIPELDKEIADIQKKAEKADEYFKHVQDLKTEEAQIRQAAETAGGATPEQAKRLEEIADEYHTVRDEDMALVINEEKKVDFGEILKNFEDLSDARIREIFDEHVFGQPGAIDAVMNAIRRMKSPKPGSHEPAAVLGFVGPTGVGKTELARALALIRKMKLLKYNMEEMDEHSKSTIKGSGLGLVDGEVKVFADDLIDFPYAVVLLDEFEKAPTAIRQMYLGYLDDGVVKNSRGKVGSMRQTIVIATMNLGQHRIKPGMDEATIKKILLEESQTTGRPFKPEDLGRFKFIVFEHLDAQSFHKILNIFINGFNNRIGGDHLVNFQWSEQARNAMVHYTLTKAEDGGRKMKKLFQDEFEGAALNAIFDRAYRIKNEAGEYVTKELNFKEGDDIIVDVRLDPDNAHLPEFHFRVATGDPEVDNAAKFSDEVSLGGEVFGETAAETAAKAADQNLDDLGEEAGEVAEETLSEAEQLERGLRQSVDDYNMENGIVPQGAQGPMGNPMGGGMPGMGGQGMPDMNDLPDDPQELMRLMQQLGGGAQ